MNAKEITWRQLPPSGYLESLPILEKVWEDLTMDLIEGKRNSQGYTCIWIIVDRFSKFAHFVPLKHPYSARQVTQTFVQEIVYGLPKSIVSDRDRIFISSSWKELL